MSNIHKLKDKKILVTGGAGFIGSNICDELIKLGCKVISLDNFSTGKIDNINHLLNNKNFKNIEGDIQNFDICRESTFEVDYVLHHAAMGSVPQSIEDPIKTNNVNVGGFVNILKASVDNNVKRFIYAASSSSYGDSTNLPKVEDNIGEPLSPYALTKNINEQYANSFSMLFNIEVIGLRYFNVFGKRQDINGPYAAVIPKFVAQLIKHESPTINGDGSFSRDFTHIKNVIKINLLSLTTNNNKALSQVYNTAVGERTTILELFETIKELLSDYDPKIKNIEVNFGKEMFGDIPHSLASIDKAKKFLKYEPEINTIDGLTETVDWFYKNLKK